MNLKVKTATWVRAIVFAIAIANQILVVFGKSPIPLDEEMINGIIVQLDVLVSSIITVAIGILNWWKNNSFTKNALEADEILAQKKLEQKK